MEIKQLKNNYTFVNEYKNTRHGFAHKSTLFRNNYEIGSNTCNYLNRTWEQYRYQTSMRGCIYSLIEKLQKKEIDLYKSNNNISRLSKELKEKVLNELEKEQMMIEYREILTEL